MQDAKKSERKAFNEFTQTKTILIQTWEAYFTNSYNTSELQIENSEYSAHENQQRIQEEGVTKGRKKLNNRKAPGTDTISNDLDLDNN